MHSHAARHLEITFSVDLNGLGSNVPVTLLDDFLILSFLNVLFLSPSGLYCMFLSFILSYFTHLFIDYFIQRYWKCKLCRPVFRGPHGFVSLSGENEYGTKYGPSF
jgi:hypothetical protein